MTATWAPSMIVPHTDEDLAIEMRVPMCRFSRERYRQAREMAGGNTHPMAAEPPVESVRLRYWYIMGKEDERLAREDKT